MMPSSIVSLENEFVRLDVESCRGSIVGLLHKRTGRQYLADPAHGRAFTLHVPLHDRFSGLLVDTAGHALESATQDTGRCQVEVTRSAESAVLTARYGSLSSAAGVFPIQVHWEASLADGDDEIHLRLTVMNGTDRQIEDVFFPWISACGIIEDRESDKVVYPPAHAVAVSDLLPLPQTTGWEEHPLAAIAGWPGMGGPAMPWVDIGGEHEGMCLASRDRSGQLHTLVLQDMTSGRRGEAPLFGVSWSFLAHCSGGRTWQSPEMVLAVHDGDWHTAADRYRATLPSWYRRTASDQLADSVASFNSTWTSRDFTQVAVTAEDLAPYGVKQLLMWEFGNYTPTVLEPDDLSTYPPRFSLLTEQFGGPHRLHAATSRARDLGVRAGLIFSQRLWNIATLDTDLRQKAERWVIRKQSGAPAVESWHHHHYGAPSWDSYFGQEEYVMCPAVPEWQEFALDNIAGIMATAGFDVLFYDQGVESYPCFNPDHEHVDPSDSLRASHIFLARMRQRIREVNPEATLIAEGIELLASQAIDLHWSWGPQQKRSGIRPHAEIWRYTLPWAPLALPVDDDLSAANQYFADGVHMAFIPRSLESGKLLSDFPEFARHLRTLTDLKDKTQPLLAGDRFVDTVGIRARGAYTKGYLGADGLAVIVANLSETPSSASLWVDASRYLVPSGPTRTFSTHGACQLLPTGNGSDHSVELRPYEVAVIAFDRGSHTDRS